MQKIKQILWLVAEKNLLRTDGRTDERTDEQKSPCVLQDFVPFGAAALLPLIPIYNHAKQENGYRWPHIALWTTCFLPSFYHHFPSSCFLPSFLLFLSLPPFLSTFLHSLNSFLPTIASLLPPSLPPSLPPLQRTKKPKIQEYYVATYVCTYLLTDKPTEQGVKLCAKDFKYYIFYSMNFIMMSLICDLLKQGHKHGYQSRMRVGRGSDKKVSNSSLKAQTQALRHKCES